MPETYHENLDKHFDVVPYGIPVAQHWISIAAIFEAIRKYNINHFIEIGAFKGGLGDMISMRKPFFQGFSYTGYEIDGSNYAQRLHGNPDYITADVFNSEVVQDIHNRIQATVGAVLLFCDNGDKPKEMQVFAPHLRVGDYMMNHDYPIEVTPDFLETFARDFPFMREIQPEVYRLAEVSLWNRIA